MKKTLCVMLALLMCLGACAALVGCGCSHVFSEEWSTDDTHHWHVCTAQECDEQSDKAEHDWDDGVLTLAPTHSTAGIRKYTCKTCGKVKTETVEPQPEVNDVEWADAFLLKDENYWLSISVAGGEEILLVKKRGGIVMTTTPRTVKLSQSYYTVEGGKYYCYTVADVQVTKSEITQEAYTRATTLIDLQALAYASFTYNEATKTYTAASVEADGAVYENVYVAFADKKINRISFTKREEGKSAEPYIIQITYGTVPTDLVLPQVTG